MALCELCNLSPQRELMISSRDGVIKLSRYWLRTDTEMEYGEPARVTHTFKYLVNGSETHVKVWESLYKLISSDLNGTANVTPQQHNREVTLHCQHAVDRLRKNIAGTIQDRLNDVDPDRRP